MANTSPLLVEIGNGLALMVGLPTIASWTPKKRPQQAKRGTFGFNTQTKSLEFWDGTNWYSAKLS